MYVYVCVSMYLYICKCVYVYIYTHMCIFFDTEYSMLCYFNNKEKNSLLSWWKTKIQQLMSLETKL